MATFQKVGPALESEPEPAEVQDSELVLEPEPVLELDPELVLEPEPVFNESEPGRSERGPSRGEEQVS